MIGIVLRLATLLSFLAERMRILVLSVILAFGPALASCSSLGTLQVQVNDARIVEREGRDLVVELITNRELQSLNGSRWAVNVNLDYSVDDNRPVKLTTDAKDYDLGSITYTRPFNAFFINSIPMGGGEFKSRWRIHLRDRMDVSPAIYEYCLVDGEEHVIWLEVYGASYSGGYLRSNTLMLKVPPSNH
jgi:hypothetical protein